VHIICVYGTRMKGILVHLALASPFIILERLEILNIRSLGADVPLRERENVSVCAYIQSKHHWLVESPTAMRERERETSAVAAIRLTRRGCPQDRPITYNQIYRWTWENVHYRIPQGGYVGHWTLVS
jgi:hypothetical protein